MNTDARVSIKGSVAALLAVVLVGAGAAGAYLTMRGSGREQIGSAGLKTAADQGRAADAASSRAEVPTVMGGADSPLPDVVVPVSEESARRAGIVLTRVTEGASTSEIRLPGVVSPNAYKQVSVTPLVTGRVSRVFVELGARVRQGQTLAEIYSPQLAEAQTRYISARAMLDAHDRELQRTGKLVEIGAASRQELERAHAEHAAQTAAVESARSQLELLGVPASRVGDLSPGQTTNATTLVGAPIDGVVTERTANAGLNVDPSTRLFTLVDLSSVWIVADVFEADLSRVGVGSEATITTASFPDRSVRGRVSYIDPQVSPETRTAKVRVEVPNTRDELRQGMYAEVVVVGRGGPGIPLIPRGAVQNVGQRTVVYLVNPNNPGTFIERDVRLGRSSGERVEVLEGIHVGDMLVSERSFFLRAERERLGLRSATTTSR